MTEVYDNDLTDECLTAFIKKTSITEFAEADKKAAVDGLALIKHHLNDAYQEINSYLIARYSLPLKQDVIDNSPLKRIECDITRYLISSTTDLMSDIIEARYKESVKWLKEVCNGKAKLSTQQQISNAQIASTASIGFNTGTKTDTEDY